MKTPLVSNEIIAPTKLNVRVIEPSMPSISKQFETSDLGEVFKPILLSNGNIAHVFKVDHPSPPAPGIYNAEFVLMPIPNGFSTKSGAIINNGDSTVIPLLIYVDAGPTEQKPFLHKCDVIPNPDVHGTQCASLMQSSGNSVSKTKQNDIVYFKTINSIIPHMRGNNLYQKIIDDFYLKPDDDHKYIYYLPTITSYNSVTYIVSRDENKIKKLIKEAFNHSFIDYVIALNGFILEVDDWNCAILLDDTETKVNGELIKSEAVVLSN